MQEHTEVIREQIQRWAAQLLLWKQEEEKKTPNI